MEIKTTRFEEKTFEELEKSIEIFLRANPNIRVISSSIGTERRQSEVSSTRGVIGTFEGPIVTNYSALIIYEEGE